MGRLDARVVHIFAAPCLQLPSDSISPEPSPAVGPEAPGGSGLEVRVMGVE